MKKIKILKRGEKQIGIRVSQDIYDKLYKLATKHEVSIQDIIRYIVEEEVDNFE